MKVRVAYTAELPDWWRRAIRAFYGQDGLATREECREWLIAYGTSEDDNLAFEADEAEGRG
jgi:hypothetical protein